jgi:hypothetical protein
MCVWMCVKLTSAMQSISSTVIAKAWGFKVGRRRESVRVCKTRKRKAIDFLKWIPLLTVPPCEGLQSGWWHGQETDPQLGRQSVAVYKTCKRNAIE